MSAGCAPTTYRQQHTHTHTDVHDHHYGSCMPCTVYSALHHASLDPSQVIVLASVQKEILAYNLTYNTQQPALQEGVELATSTVLCTHQNTRVMQLFPSCKVCPC